MDDVKMSASSDAAADATAGDQKMQDAVDAGVAAAEGKSGEEVSDSRKEEWKKRDREHSTTQDPNENPAQRLKTIHEDADTDVSLKSSATYPAGNRHPSAQALLRRGPDAQQMAYRDSVEDGSVASVDDASQSSRNTWKSKASLLSHQQQLSDRRIADKEKYASMSKEERKSYNAKRRDKYHRQSQESRQKHRERERNRYHHSRGGSVVSEADSKERQARRTQLAEKRLRSKQPMGTNTL